MTTRKRTIPVRGYAAVQPDGNLLPDIYTTRENAQTAVAYMVNSGHTGWGAGCSYPADWERGRRRGWRVIPAILKSRRSKV